MTRRTSPPPLAQALPYRPPQQLLAPCPACGRLLLWGLCVDGMIRNLGVPVTPILGKPHRREADGDEDVCIPQAKE